MPFLDTNIAEGLRINDIFQVGRSDGDDNQAIEENVKLPWASDPRGSYLYYDCTVGVMLDSGLVVHNRLPQGGISELGGSRSGAFFTSNPSSNEPDTLAHVALDDPKLDQPVGLGVNLRCRDQYRDIIQRMGHARYWFRIWGQAIRIGYPVPIPGILFIGGVRAVPYDKNPQWAYNGIVPGGNYSGAILWRAKWSLWYTTILPPQNQYIPAADPSAHISQLVPPPADKYSMQAPYSQSDDNADK